MKSLKLSLSVVAAIMLTGCTSEDRAELRVNYRLQGTWDVEHESTDCVEQFVFKSDDSFVYTSLDRRSTGIYEYPVDNFVDASNDVNTYQLDLAYLDSNALSDCNGESKDDFGRTTVYVQHYGQYNMHWLDKSSNGNLLDVMNKR